MTAAVSQSTPGAHPAKHTGTRIAVGLLGLATVIVGVVLLFNPVTAARTLALLLGVGFILAGLLEMAIGWDSPSRWGPVVLGGVLVVGGLLAMGWPGITLWALVLITGLSLVAHGVGRVLLAVMGRHEIPGWPWLALAGALGILFGVLALAWPEATVLVLCLVLGAQVTIFGLLLLAAAFVRPGRMSTAPSRV